MGATSARGLFRATGKKSKPVAWHKARSKWQAAIGVSGKSVYLGGFDAEAEAAAAYAQAAQRLFGDFAVEALGLDGSRR